MDALFDADEMGFGDDFSNVSGFGGLSDSSQGFIDHAGIDALMQTMSGIDGNPALGGQMIGYSQIGDWNGDGIWDIEQDINSIPNALGQWLYGMALVEAGVNPYNGEIFDQEAYDNRPGENQEDTSSTNPPVNTNSVTGEVSVCLQSYWPFSSEICYSSPDLDGNGLPDAYEPWIEQFINPALLPPQQ